MKYRKLNNGDYSFGRNADDFVSDVDAVSQAIRTNLLLLLGEWWEDTDKGLPLFQNIVGAAGTPDSQQAADLIVQGAITGTPGVTSIKEFSSSYANRTYSLQCRVDTVYGEASLEVSL